jgi:sialidase-1
LSIHLIILKIVGYKRICYAPVEITVSNEFRQEMPEPFLHKQVLFQARSAGYQNYRIPGISVAPDGTILAYCEARYGQGGDWDLIDILMRRSLDNGVTWELPRRVVAHQEFNGGGIHNFVTIPDRETGEVHAVFCRNYAHAYYTKSANNGQTFSIPVDITPVFEQFRSDYDWHVCATGPGHGIQLATGRLIVPVWLSTGTDGAHRPSDISLIYSGDHGQSWQRGPMVARTDDQFRYPSETVPVELSDGRVLFNSRSESDPHRRLVSISPDGVTNWSPPIFDNALLEPQCMGSIIRLESSEQKPPPIVFANPDNLDQTMLGASGNRFDRKRLTAKLSLDDCRTWPVASVIESGPSGYSDLTEAPDGASFACTNAACSSAWPTLKA